MTSMYFDWRQHPVVLLVCAKVQYMSQTERSSLKKTFFKRSGLSKLSCVLLCTYIHSVRLSGRKTSLQATVVSMVTGRVEVREEVERTGCSESVREEVGDAYRRSSHSKTASGVFCGPIVCCLSPSNQPSVLQSLSSGGGVHWGSRYLCDTQTFSLIGSLFTHTHILYIDIEVVKGPKAQTVFLADISLSGRFLCHHGNPASGIVSS